MGTEGMRDKAPKPSKKEYADEILAAKDSCGMDVQKATEVLADDSADEETKSEADDLLATVDESGFDTDGAEQVLVDEASSGDDGAKKEVA